MICDKNKGLKLILFSEEIFKLRSSKNSQTGVKGVLKHQKRKDVVKWNRRCYCL